MYQGRFQQKSHSYTTNILASVAFSWIIGKVILVIGLLVEDIYRLSLFGYQSIIEAEATFPTRNGLFDLTFYMLSFVFMLFLIYGVVYGKYHFKLHRVELKLKDLPKQFDGFKIVQFSDAHLGSFDKMSGFKKGIDLIKSTQLDLLVFTGDLVNNLAAEAEPYIPHFKELTAKYGKLAILGNHDYADYVSWPNEIEKRKNLERLAEIHAEMGFHLLDNENVTVQKNDAYIYVAGVQNWGLPPFPQHGDLNKAIQGIPENAITILLSHDASHWDAQIKNHKHQIHLTLSGHTHGMQFGIDLPFFKWSPVKLKYPKWAGLYRENSRYLYVNRGFGFLGFPGRSGIRPEVTEFVLKSE